eukprot:SAG31_NODE_2673_length_5268_cov_2.551944_6_plen_102_part_00
MEQLANEQDFISAACGSASGCSQEPSLASPMENDALEWDALEPAASVLAGLGLSDYEAAFACENILTAEDVAILTREDLQELGLKIGDRNRVLTWAAHTNK